jgi:hypothetical protein
MIDHDWYETLITEEVTADKLQQIGYTYKQALELIRKYGLEKVQWLLEGKNDTPKS